MKREVDLIFGHKNVPQREILCTIQNKVPAFKHKKVNQNES